MTTFFKIIRYKMYSYRVLYVTLQPKRWTFPISRVVYRGCNGAHAVGGVVYADAYYDASSAGANVGSRLDKLITLNRPTIQGTCSLRWCRGKRTSANYYYRKAETSSVGWSLVGQQWLEEVRPRDRKAERPLNY